MAETRRKPRHEVTIIVRPSTRRKAYPLTAYIAGTQIEGIGRTVQKAIDDLFTSKAAVDACADLEACVETER